MSAFPDNWRELVRIANVECDEMSNQQTVDYLLTQIIRDSDGAAGAERVVMHVEAIRALLILERKETEKLRALAGPADVGPSFAEITKGLPRRSHEDASKDVANNE